MAVNQQKIRLGAATQLIFFSDSPNSIDLGATIGGMEVNYNPTMFAVEIDQCPMEVASYRTKEQVDVAFAIAQYQMDRLAASIAYAASTGSGVITTASGSLSAPGAAVVTVVGPAGSTSYSYQWVAFSSAGDSIPGTSGTTATGPAALSATNYCSIAPPAAVTGAVGYKLLRVTGGTAQGLIATFYTLPTANVNDTGLTAAAYTAASTAATYPNSDRLNFGGQVLVPNGAFDWGIPKNDGSANMLRGHLHKVYQAKGIKLNHDRDKVTQASKLTLTALADMTKAVGQQGGYLVEEY